MQVIQHPKQSVNVSRPERIASLIAGGALAAYAIKKRSKASLALGLLGGGLMQRGATGVCQVYKTLGVRTAPLGHGEESTSLPYELGIRVEKTITIGKPRAEVFAYWRDFDNLPRFMNHLVSVSETGRRSHWVAKGPAGRTVDWDAEIINEIENELIGWRSLPGASVANAGSVHFKDAPGGRGTEVRVLLQYNPPGGTLGAFFAKMFGEEPSQQIDEDLRRLKQILEAGENPTIDGQTSGRRDEDGHARRQKQVQQGSEMSFPASDTPSYGGVR